MHFLHKSIQPIAPIPFYHADHPHGPTQISGWLEYRGRALTKEGALKKIKSQPFCFGQLQLTGDLYFLHKWRGSELSFLCFPSHSNFPIPANNFNAMSRIED
jgi:hypothetical protein